MESQYEEISRWSPWCLENTCSLLQIKFPNSAIWIVRPSKMLRSLFSCFHHFVQSSLVGIPTYSATYGALPQIERLLADACYKLHKQGKLKMELRSAILLPIVLIGFSKGCVVLNQVLHELMNYVTIDPSIAQMAPYPHSHPRHHLSTSSISSVSSISSTEDSTYLHHGHRTGCAASPHTPRKVSPGPEPMVRSSSTSAPRSGATHSNSTSSYDSASASDYARSLYRSSSSSRGASSASNHFISLSEREVERIKHFLSQVKAFYWLDAGHSGGHGAWIIDDTLLKLLASLKADVRVHVTPQQVCDPHRTWIGEEEKEFIDRLRYYRANVEETLHFENDERSLEKHFRVLEVF